MARLKVGDTVQWRGCFGSAPPVPAVVVAIDEVEPGTKYGDSVDSMDWADVPSRAVVNLDNGHWAYGRQISH
jgi:hypothetical protein